MSPVPPSQFLQEHYLTVAQFAEMISKTERSVYRMMALGTAPPKTRIGRNIYFRRESVLAWITAQEEQPIVERRRRG